MSKQITPTIPKRIPYAISDYGRLRRENAYYVDKTRYIPLIEAAPFYLFCIRPRRFGKSLWLSVLQHYYDVNQADNFEILFGKTYIGQQPTAERNSYLIILLNFSLIDSDMGKFQKSFEEMGHQELDNFLARYERFFSEDEIQDIKNREDFVTKLQGIFSHAGRKYLKIYLLIDDYDQVVNLIMSHPELQVWRDLKSEIGFLHYFFNVLKRATGGQMSGLSRLFMTGVLPITMDHVSSGFNIGLNISLNSRFNEMIGFTEDEVLALLQTYQQVGWLRLPILATLKVMKTWYNNYNFGEEAQTSMFNSDMVLYFLNEAQDRTKLPLNLIDQNIRIG